MQNNPDGTITLIPAEGQIVEAGTPIIAVNMNNMEGGIEAAHNSIETHQADNVKHVTAAERTTWNGKANASHTHTKANITDFPASLPASDVYAWAKASTKPSYTAPEVGAATAAQGALATNAMPKGGGTWSGESNHADNLVTRAYLKDYAEAVAANAAASGTVTLNIETANNFNLTIAGATTLAFSNPSASGRACSITVKINMPATLYAITFPASVKWAGDKIPTFTAGKTAYLTFATFDGGARWYGFDGGTDFTT